MTVLLAALLSASGLLMLWPARVGSLDVRLRHVAPTGISEGRPLVRPSRAAQHSPSELRALVVAFVAAVAVALLVGGAIGVAAGAATAAVVFRWLRQLEPASVRQLRVRLAQDLPWAADLMAAAVEGGAPLEGAVRAVAAATAGPLAGELRSVASALELGAPPAVAWSGADASLGPLGRSLVRAADHGTPASDLMGRLADDLRATARAESSAAVRAAGVRALAPLGACFLPAFLLLAVVPMVAGVASELLG